MVVEQTPRVVEKFKKQGYPITDESVSSGDLQATKLDDFHSVLEAKTYRRRSRVLRSVRAFEPGLNEIIFIRPC